MHQRVKAKFRENGLVLGPMLLFRDHGPVRHTLSPVFDNPRFAQGLQPDFMIMYEQLRPGENSSRSASSATGRRRFASGPRLHQRRSAGCQDRRRRGLQAAAGSRNAVQFRLLPPDRYRGPAGHHHVRPAAGRRGDAVLGNLLRIALRHPARAGRGDGRRRLWRRRLHTLRPYSPSETHLFRAFLNLKSLLTGILKITPLNSATPPAISPILLP